jgi:AbrB family looped-hinge helix DNA binding protein
MFGVVTVGDKGQIVIPAKARKIFDIKTGDRVFVLGEEGEGLALISEEKFLAMAEMIRKVAGK